MNLVFILPYTSLIKIFKRWLTHILLPEIRSKENQNLQNQLNISKKILYETNKARIASTRNYLSLNIFKVGGTRD